MYKRQIFSHANKMFFKMHFPPTLSGTQLIPPQVPEDKYSPEQHLPAFFLENEDIRDLPVLLEPRRALLYYFIDLHHHRLCKTNDFHIKPDVTCECKYCGETAGHYLHHRRCPRLKDCSPTRLLYKILSEANDTAPYVV